MKTCFALLVVSTSAWPWISEAADVVEYGIEISNAPQHLAEVSAAFPATPGTQFVVQMPVWRTGRYELLPLANGVRNLVASGRDGRPLPARKIDRASWQIDKAVDEAVTVRYELYANELGQRTRHIDDSHAYLDASAVWVYNEDLRANPLTVELSVPENWRSRSGMETGACAHCFVAANYDLLIDSPIETGVHEYRSFEVDGKTIELAIWGVGNHDGGKIEADLKKIVPTVGSLFGSYPFDRYLFIVHATDGERGATEHLNSTVIQQPRWSFAPRKDYVQFVLTATHEFFHTWNVKEYRPAAMVPYDYQSENYSDLLWIVEGHTSYFDTLLSLRADVVTRAELLEEFGSVLDSYLQRPGRFYQSAVEASFDQWIQTSGERARNASVSIYEKGELLALAMDLRLRKASKGKVGVEDLHRRLWESKRVAQGGYTSADVVAILTDLSEADWSPFWMEYVVGTEELPLVELLRDAGLELRAEPDKEDDGRQEAWWGLKTEDGGAEQFAVISEVERDSPAWQGGLVSGDIVVALDGLKVSAQDFVERSAALTAGPVTVTLFRRDELQTRTIVPLPRPPGKRELKSVEAVSREQKALHTQWLGVPWPAE